MPPAFAILDFRFAIASIRNSEIDNVSSLSLPVSSLIQQFMHVGLLKIEF